MSNLGLKRKRGGSEGTSDDSSELTSNSDTPGSSLFQSSDGKGGTASSTPHQNSKIKKAKSITSDESDNPDDFLPPKKNKHAYDRQTIIEACEQLKGGVTAAEVARRLKASVKTIVQWRDRYVLKKKPDVKTKRPKAKRSRDTIIEVCNRWKQGESSGSISRSMGLSMSTLRTWKRKYYENKEPIPIYTATGKQVSNDTILEACNRMKNGESLQSISKGLGTEVRTLRKWQAKYLKEQDITSKIGNYHDKKTILSICNRLNDGESAESVAKEFSVDLKKVQNWQKRYIVNGEVSTVNERPHNDEETIREVCSRLNKGQLAKDLAREYNVCPATVKRWGEVYIVDGKVTVENVEQFGRKAVFEVCKRLKQGDSAKDIADELGICTGTVYTWKHKYSNEEPEVIKGGPIYDRSTVVEACTLLNRGVTIRKVAEKLNVHRTSLHTWRNRHLRKSKIKDGAKYDRETIIQACNLMKQGETAASVARKLNIRAGNVYVWRTNHVDSRLNDEIEYPDGRRYKKSMIFETCERLKKGQTLEEISEALGINKKIVEGWQSKYVAEDKKFLFQPKVNIVAIAKNGKLEDKTAVGLERDPRGSKHICVGREQNNHLKNGISSKFCKQQSFVSKVFVPLRKVYIPKKMKLQIVHKVDEGVSIARLSREFYINKVTIKTWVNNRELLAKST